MEETLRQQASKCLKICLFGPESTGKSTLSRKLAKHYSVPWVPEFAREYLQDLWDKEQLICRPKDLLPIATGQMQLENNIAKTAKKLLICDTDLLTTKVYSEAYYDGWCPQLISKYALENKYDIYFLTYIDTPWQADDLRDRPERRKEMFEYFRKALEDNNRPFVLLKGSVEERMEQATKAINQLLD